MNSKTTWSLVAGAAVLFALIFFVEHPWREARMRQANRVVMPGLKPGAIQKITIQSDREVLQAERQGHLWKLVKPVDYPADAARVETFLQTVEHLEWQYCLNAEQLNSHEEPEKEFGFDPPRFSIVFQEGKNSRRLLVGTNSAWGDQVYLRQVGNEAIYLVSADLLKAIPQEKNTWRDAHLVDLENMPIETIKVRSSGKNFELQRDDAGLWNVSTLEARADTAKVEELLTQLQSIQVTNYVSEGADLEPYGLQSTQNPELELTFLQNTNVLFWLQMGSSPANNPNLVYVRRQNPTNVVSVPKEPLRGWQAATSAFRDLHMLSCSPSLIDTIEIQSDREAPFTLKQKGTNWQVAGQNMPVDAELMQGLLAALTNVDLEVEQTVVIDYAPYGLTKPLLKMSFFGIPAVSAKTNLLAEVSFGAGTNQPAKIYERRADERSVNTIDPQIFERFPRNSWQLRDRRIWNFAASNVVGVVIRQKGSTQKFIRDPDQNWTLAPGSFGRVTSEYLEEALERMGSLKAVWWNSQSQGEAGLEGYGFAEADHQVSIQVKQDGKLETFEIQFGKLSPYLNPYASVTLGGQRLVFEFDVRLYNDFVKNALTIPPAYRKANK